ncbi:alpha-amlyase [Pseudoduganella lutea]|uniref:Alpha-amlyase n=2 Tax=Pseudoduganella lutea TaxID=321985 RepID=A0A4P6L6P2_9BURK|nr:alpha-amlyase [Pseudoduganella lutea]
MLAMLVAPAPAKGGPASYRIDHLEPASWWTGMRHPALQLIVHGEHIADLRPDIGYPGVRIAGTTRVANPNYLFIDLELAAGVRPGSFDIAFHAPGAAGKAAVLKHRYQLQPRAPGSRERQGFTGRDAIYQVMPDRFANGDPANDSIAAMPDKANRAAGGGRHGGDLAGMTAHLDYIAAMGYTQVWPTPLLENDMPAYSYHGYAATDHYRIDRRYGSNDDFRAFVAAARARGIGVIQDVVLNHIGAGHWWMKDLPMPDWITHEGKPVMTRHHRVAVGDPYGSRADARNFTEGWFSRGMPDLNGANPYVANYLIQNTIWWIEYAGLSGLRVDTWGYSNNAFLAEWSRRVMAEYPNLNLVGEEWSTRVPVVARWQAGKANHDGYVSHLPSLMDFPLNDALRRALTSTATDSDHGTFSLNDLYETLAQDHLYPAPQDLVLFEGNHDLPRTWSVLGEDMGLWKMAMAYVLTAPRIPQFYYGTEILMGSTTQGRDDASYRHDFPGGWPGDKVNAFTGTGLTPAQREAQAFLKKLLNWRKGATVIHRGRTMHFGPEQDTYVFFRYGGNAQGGGKVMVALNKNRTPVTLDTARFGEMLDGVHAGTDVLTGQTFHLERGITLPARTAIILELKQ